MPDRASPPRVIVLGAGFGGLAAVRALRNAPVDVLLVDANNYHLFTPLLYQVASSLLDPSQIAYPARAIIRRARNVRFRLGRVRAVDLDRRRLVLDGAEVGYDYLILAAGAINDYFGNESLARRTFPLKSLDEALALRYRILEQFERASTTEDPATRRRLMRFAVVGAGPTGVEYVGALSELIRLVLRKDFPELDMSQVRVVLVDGLPHVLPAYRPRLRRAAERALEKKGVELVLGTFVRDTDDAGVHLVDGRTIEAGTVVWTAGVRASGLTGSLGVELTRRGQVKVGPALEIPGHPGAFAVGDLAFVEQDGKPLPMISPVAIQEGNHAARNVLRLVQERPVEPFRYRNRGSMATIGRNQAVAEIGPFRFTGFAAWLVWLFVHLALLIGFRNRIVALVNWAIDYLFYDRPVRLIARAPLSPGQIEKVEGEVAPDDRPGADETSAPDGAAESEVASSG